MKWKLFIVGVLIVGMLVTVGCQPKTAHERYRQRTYRLIRSSDAVGMADDVDAVFLSERPSHLSPWLNE